MTFFTATVVTGFLATVFDFTLVFTNGFGRRVLCGLRCVQGQHAHGFGGKGEGETASDVGIKLTLAFSDNSGRMSHGTSAMQQAAPPLIAPK